MNLKKLNLKSLMISELDSLKSAIEHEISSRAHKMEAIEELKKLMAEKGVDMNELVAGVKGKSSSRSGSGAKAPVKFKDPKNPDNTWSGRGKQPLWLSGAISGGASLSDFKI